MILLMGGTSEGRELAHILHQKGYPILVTTTTEYAATLLDAGIDSVHRPLDEAELASMIRDRGIRALIDATHPFAVQASAHAKEAAGRTGVAYLRWEREGLLEEAVQDTLLIRVANAQEAIAALEPYERILLTIGSKELPAYRHLFSQSTRKVYVRVLPLPGSMQTCWDLGIPVGQIIAGQGPFSTAWNCAMIEQYQIQAILTKDSGVRGGVPEKLAAARHMRIPVVMIHRPDEISEEAIRSIEQLETELRRIDAERRVF